MPYSLYHFYQRSPRVTDYQVRLFADDCDAYSPVTKSEDAEYLQAGTYSLMSWAEEWSIFFHPDKYEVIRVTSKKKPLNYAYKMTEHVLRTVGGQEIPWGNTAKKSELK